jgi:hypothetical protein
MGDAARKELRIEANPSDSSFEGESLNVLPERHRRGEWSVQSFSMP